MNNHIIYRSFKRLIDIILSMVLLLITLPLAIVIAIVLLLTFRRSPFYIQQRGITLENQLCRIVKFRTMKDLTSSFGYADDIVRHLSPSIQISKFCKWLRKTGLDELPQLINVLKGEMSMIGPRPLSINDLEVIKTKRKKIYNRRKKIKSKPGISGYWQIYGNRKEGLLNLIELEEYYEHKKSFRLDLFLMLITLPVMVFARHSDSIIHDNDEDF